MLLQGVAVAAAMPPQPVAADSQEAQTPMPPCHGMGAAVQAVAETASEPSPHACCDADCPNMSTCLLGAYAPAGLPVLRLAATRVETLAFRGADTPPPLPRNRLRPPIVLHG